MRKFFMLFSLCPVFMLLCACSFSFQVGLQSAEVTMLGATDSTLSSTKSFLVALPNDFIGDAVEQDSGFKTQQAMLEAMRARGIKAIPSQNIRMEMLLEEAQQAQADYILALEIARWDDPPSFFQYSLDEAQITLSVYDASTGEALRTDSVACHSTPTVVYGVGAGSPADCLQEGFEDWLAKVAAAVQ